MHWRYGDVEDLPQDVYRVLVELLNAEAERMRDGGPGEI